MEIGDHIGMRWQITARLGDGGMGEVYRARDARGRETAVKVLSPLASDQTAAAKRFEREALAMSRLQHPNIVAVLEFGVVDGGARYLVMELVEGVTLSGYLGRGPLASGWVAAIARPILTALDHAHALGVVHRDLKPDNVMLIPGAGIPDVKLVDFGIAKLVGDAAAELGADKLTRTGVVCGTPDYIAPEQALGRAVDARCDLYALGVILFEMLAGRRPFENEDPMAVMRMHAALPPPPLRQLVPDLHPQLEAVVMRALSKAPAERFGSAREMARALDAAMR